MNLLTGHVQRATFTGKDTDEHVTLSQHHESAPVVLGIRPEFIYPSAAGLSARIILSEYLGSHCYVHLDSALGNLIMRTDASQRFNTDETLCLQFDPSHICLFNSTTENALL
jgi:ABC-type sugar transport system ATPase subunit